MFRNSLIAAAALLASAFALPAWAQIDTDYTDTPFADVQALANGGNGQAQLEMGQRYYYDEGLKDDKVALDWFLKSGANGEAWGWYEAATMYILGEGVPADPVQALVYYRKAADMGLTIAFYDIGVIYYLGEGVPKDSREAAKWLSVAAEDGHGKAQWLLGILYRDGDGVPQNPEKAVTLLKAAVKSGIGGAASALEEMYANGIGVAKDPIRSHAWRTMAYYLSPNREKAPTEGKEVSVILTTPKLSQDDNMKAWNLYMTFMVELGFAEAE